MANKNINLMNWIGNSHNFIRKHWFGICILLILAISIFLRFYNYDHRWALSSDQARDALVARESIRQLKVPLIGPFSSAGNFTTGPIWYWWLAVSTAIYPSSVLTPWIVLTVSYVAIVYIMILIGRDLGGKVLALISGLFTAVSPAMIAQSANLTNPSLVALFSTCALYFAIKYLKGGSNLSLFLFPFFISQAIQVHFQSVNLLLLIPLLLLIKRPNIKGLLLPAAGIIIPFIPYIIFDINNNYYNTRGIFDYVVYGQYKVYLPNRWLSYAGVFWPNTWAKVIGGVQPTGYITMGLLLIVTFYSLVKRRVTKPMITIIVSFLLMFVLLRYYRGERFDGYFIFIHPFILILTAWMCYQLIKFNRFVGLLVILMLIAGSVTSTIDVIKNATNYNALEAEYWSNLFSEKFPNEKFAIYSFRSAAPAHSLPLVLFLDEKNKIKDDGYKIGFGSTSPIEKLHHKKLKDNKLDYEFWDLNSSSSAKLKKAGWGPINPSFVYRSTVEWYVNK